MSDRDPNPGAPSKPTKQPPSIGRVVHFCRGTSPRDGVGGVVYLAAVIVFVHTNGAVNLKVLANGVEVHTDFFAYQVSEGKTYDEIGTWSFPPFVPPK